MSAAAQRDWRANQTTLPNPPEVGPQPPYRYEGGSLGFMKNPEVVFSAPDGSHYSAGVQTILEHIDQFAEPDRSRVLFAAGIHYRINPWQMVDPAYQPPEDDPFAWMEDANG